MEIKKLKNILKENNHLFNNQKLFYQIVQVASEIFG